MPFDKYKAYRENLCYGSRRKKNGNKFVIESTNMAAFSMINVSLHFLVNFVLLIMLKQKQRNNLSKRGKKNKVKSEDER